MLCKVFVNKIKVLCLPTWYEIIRITRFLCTTLVFNILNLKSRVLNWKENKKVGTILCFWVRIQNRNWKYFFENNNIFILFGFKNIYANFFIFIHLTENDCTCNNLKANFSCEIRHIWSGLNSLNLNTTSN